MRGHGERACAGGWKAGCCIMSVSVSECCPGEGERERESERPRRKGVLGEGEAKT